MECRELRLLRSSGLCKFVANPRRVHVGVEFHFSVKGREYQHNSGIDAFEHPAVNHETGDIWELARVDALGLVDAESAERIEEPKEIEIRPVGLEIVAEGEN